MPLPDSIQQIARTIAQLYGLPLEIVLGIIAVESGGNPWAVRFEPAFLTRYVPAKVKTFGASLETERIARATSYGCMQIMGQVARELKFEMPFLSQLCDPYDGINYGCKHLVNLRDRYLEKCGWDGVIAAYNAGSPRMNADGTYVNQSYVEKVKKISNVGAGS